MFDPSGFRAAEVQFDKDAKVIGSADDVVNLATDPGITDLIIMAHGWNNNIADARSLYTKLGFRSIAPFRIFAPPQTFHM